MAKEKVDLETLDQVVVDVVPAAVVVDYETDVTGAVSVTDVGGTKVVSW